METRTKKLLTVQKAKVLPQLRQQSQETGLTITLNPFVAEICSRIAEDRGIDPLDLLYSYIRRGITKDWDFQEKKPRGNT